MQVMLDENKKEKKEKRIMELLVVTGLSGAGKSLAVNALEDIGYFCIDNIPAGLMPRLLDFALQGETMLEKVAVVVDIRGCRTRSDVQEALTSMDNREVPYRVLFLDASDDVLARRYKETRRIHPLCVQEGVSMTDAIEQERRILQPFFERADFVVDTSLLSNAQLRQRFSPALNARAGGILSALTGGKYSKVALTREFEALVSQADDPTPRKALNLSQGTIDQVYLAVRLAVCREALPAKEPPPLILDDALVNFDDDRMKLALNYLRMVAKDRQVILFTCHSRERECLEKADGVNFICLQS